VLRVFANIDWPFPFPLLSVQYVWAHKSVLWLLLSMPLSLLVECCSNTDKDSKDDDLWYGEHIGFCEGKEMLKASDAARCHVVVFVQVDIKPYSWFVSSGVNIGPFRKLLCACLLCWELRIKLRHVFIQMISPSSTIQPWSKLKCHIGDISTRA
jgi:hypothetical protein